MASLVLLLEALIRFRPNDVVSLPSEGTTKLEPNYVYKDYNQRYHGQNASFGHNQHLSYVGSTVKKVDESISYPSYHTLYPKYCYLLDLVP